MTSKDFCYWLQGFFELSGGEKPLTAPQVKQIKAHLNMVFKHEIDPSYGDKVHQATLQEIHDAITKKIEEAPKPPKKDQPDFKHPFDHDILIRC